MMIMMMTMMTMMIIPCSADIGNSLRIRPCMYYGVLQRTQATSETSGEILVLIHRTDQY